MQRDFPLDANARSPRTARARWLAFAAPVRFYPLAGRLAPW